MANKILKAFFSWWALALWGIVLAWVAWPWADHMVSYFWILVASSVLAGELWSKIKTGRTVSQNVQARGLDDRLRFWIHEIIWILFALTLAGHFLVKLF